MPRLSDEHKRFISKLFLDDKLTGVEIPDKFNETYGFKPSASQINKYQYYNEQNPPKQDTDDNADNGDNDDEGVKVITKDTRKVTNIYDFGEGHIPDDIYDKICSVIGWDKKRTFELLKRCYEKGYTKINLDTGDVSK